MGADIYIKSISDAATAKWEGSFNNAVAARNKFSCPQHIQAALNAIEWFNDSKRFDELTEDDKKIFAEYKALQEKVEEFYQKMFPTEGYFRDSYNESSLFWTLGLSWWRDVGDVLNEDGYLPLEEIRCLRDEVETREIALPDSAKEKGEEEEALKFYEEKKQRFLRFLDKALELNEPILCSV